MKFKVTKLEAVENEIKALEPAQQELLKSEYAKIENEGIEFVRVKPIQKKIFEIKSNELRSLFKYKEGQIIVVGVVFVKKNTENSKRKNKACRNKIERGVVMEYVFVKDSEGYVFKKLANEVSADAKIITEKEYMKKSGLAAYEKEFGHGGARENAGRKQKFKQPLKFQIRVTQEEKDFINYAREHHLSYSAMMK